MWKWFQVLNPSGGLRLNAQEKKPPAKFESLTVSGSTPISSGWPSAGLSPGSSGVSTSDSSGPNRTAPIVTDVCGRYPYRWAQVGVFYLTENKNKNKKGPPSEDFDTCLGSYEFYLWESTIM